jgi:hypothetical protein
MQDDDENGIDNKKKPRVAKVEPIVGRAAAVAPDGTKVSSFQDLQLVQRTQRFEDQNGGRMAVIDFDVLAAPPADLPGADGGQRP